MITKRIIKVPIYDYKVTIVVTDSREEAKSIYPNIGDDADGIVLEDKNYSVIIIPPNNPSTIVHECEHLKNCIWSYIGQKTDSTNDEADAYLVEYLFKQVSKVVAKHNSKKLLDT